MPLGCRVFTDTAGRYVSGGLARMCQGLPGRRDAAAEAIRGFLHEWFAGCRGADVGVPQGTTAHPSSPTLVTVAAASVQDVPEYLDEIGTCTAREVVSIQPLATGQIMQIHFVDGADLTRGQLLFTIDPRPYQAALDQARAGLAQNEASLTLARRNFARDQQLLPAKAISTQTYQTDEDSVAAAEAQVKASHAQIETAQVNLNYTTIASPIDGRAGKRLIDLGNIVTANSGQTLLVIQRMDPIYADFIVPESSLSSIRDRMASGTLKTLVYLPAQATSQAREGNLTFLDNTVQLATGTIALRATLFNPDRHFWPGQFVRIRLVLRILVGAVLIPYEAVEIGQNGAYVYVLRPGPTTEIRQITLGQRQGDMVVVLKGLAEGEEVVTAGQLTVVPGAPVRVQEPAGPEAATCPATAPSSQPGGTP